MADKKNIKKTTKINNKKSLNTGIMIKPAVKIKIIKILDTNNITSSKNKNYKNFGY